MNDLEQHTQAGLDSREVISATDRRFW